MKNQSRSKIRDFFVGYYAGPYNTSSFETSHFDNIGQAMLFVKSKLDYFQRACYGFTVFTNRQFKKGSHYIPEVLLRWHNDGEDCHGELVNPDVGWRIYIDENNQIREEHFTPKGE